MQIDAIGRMVLGFTFMVNIIVLFSFGLYRYCVYVVVRLLSDSKQFDQVDRGPSSLWFDYSIAGRGVVNAQDALLVYSVPYLMTMPFQEH